MKKLLALSLFSVLFLAACSSVSIGGGDSNTLKIGFVGSLTGDAAGIGQDEKSTVEMFFRDNPKISEKKVEVIYEDGQCNGQKAASAAEKLVSVDKVSLILGGLCSGETLGIAPIAEKNKVLVFSSLSSSPEVSTAGDYIFRNAPVDSLSAVVMATDVGKTYKNAALVTQNNDYASAYRKAMLEELPKAGVKIVVDETYNSGTTDFRTVLQKVKKSKADVLLDLAGETAPGAFLIKQAKELGLKLPFYAGDIMAGKETFEIAKDAAEGLFVIMPAADTSNNQVQALLDKFTKEVGRSPVAEAYVLLSWDWLNILKTAIETVGYDATKLKDYLYQMPAYQGLGGETKFDSNGDARILPLVTVAKGGKFVVRK